MNARDHSATLASRDKLFNRRDQFGMLEFAGCPVIMGNAVDSLKSRGWHMTGHQDEAGVAQAIERFVLDR